MLVGDLVQLVLQPLRRPIGVLLDLGGLILLHIVLDKSQLLVLLEVAAR